MSTRIDRDLMNYAIMEELTPRKITNFAKKVYSFVDDDGNIPFMQLISLRSIVRTMGKRLDKEGKQENINAFNHFFPSDDLFMMSNEDFEKLVHRK